MVVRLIHRGALNWVQWAQFSVHASVFCFCILMLNFMRRMTAERVKQEELMTQKVMEAYDKDAFDKRVLEAADDWFDDKRDSKTRLREAIALKRQNQGMSVPTGRTISK